MNIEVVNFNKMSEENQESLNIIELNIEDNHDIAKKKSLINCASDLDWWESQKSIILDQTNEKRLVRYFAKKISRRRTQL